MLIYLLCAAVLTGCLTSWVWCFVNKWEVSEECTISQWVQINAPKKIGEMIQCQFCFNFWLSLLFSIVLAVTMKEWYFVFVPLFSTTIGRWLSA